MTRVRRSNVWGAQPCFNRAVTPCVLAPRTRVLRTRGRISGSSELSRDARISRYCSLSGRRFSWTKIVIVGSVCQRVSACIASRPLILSASEAAGRPDVSFSLRTLPHEHSSLSSTRSYLRLAVPDNSFFPRIRIALRKCFKRRETNDAASWPAEIQPASIQRLRYRRFVTRLALNGRRGS